MKTNNLAEVLPRDLTAMGPAIIEVASDGASREIGHAQMQDEADRMAAGLRAAGHARGARIGILAGNSVNFFVSFLAIMRAGMIAVPINFKLPRDTITYIIGDAGISMMLVDAARADMVVGIPTVAIDVGPAWAALLVHTPAESMTMGDDEVATILYTSGSTGQPKGVPLTHGGYIWVMQAFLAAGAPFAGKRGLVAAPLYHMNALIQSLLIAMQGGTTVLLMQFSARLYIEAASKFRCQMVTAVPTMYALVAREVECLARFDLSHVESAKSGSAPVTEAMFAALANIFPNAATSNWWGTTESGPVAFGPHPQGLPRPTLALGYPMSGTEYKLTDGPHPDEGVLWVRCPAVSPGYLNLPAESAKRFQDGWYNTGDVMRRDENGYVYFVGRADDMFVCGGENIYPGEVEKLLEKHPGVLQAAVLPVADEIKGQIPAAFIVRCPGFDTTIDDIKQFALAHGPAYQHPRFVEFIDEMPLAGTNKIDKRVLVQRAARFSR